MDLTTILVSTAVSVLASTIVTLLTVPTIAVRQARAQRRELARQRLAAVVNGLQLDLNRYRARVAGGRREPTTGHGDDTDRAAKVISAAADLGWLRRLLVVRRSRIIFGHWTEMALLYPGEDHSKERFSGVLFGQIRENGRDVDMTSHLIHQAFSHPPGHRSQARLARQLWYLGHAL